MKKFNDLIVSRRRESFPAHQRIGTTDEQPGVAKAAAGVSGTLGATQNHTEPHTGTHRDTGAHRNTVPRNSKVAPVGRWPLNRKHGACVRVFVNL